MNDFLKDENGGLVLPLNGKALNDEEWIKFKALKIDKNIKSIKKSKLPFDFCEKACVLVDEFRRKTYNLEEEWVIYFDYSTGEVIYDKDKINYKIEYNVSEFLLNYFNKKTKIKAYKMEYE